MDRFENCIGLYAYSKVDFKTSRWPRHVWVFGGVLRSRIPWASHIDCNQ